MLEKERIPVTIYLMNGVKVNGQVKGFDSYIIMLEDEKTTKYDIQACSINYTTY